MHRTHIVVNLTRFYIRKSSSFLRRNSRFSQTWWLRFNCNVLFTFKFDNYARATTMGEIFLAYSHILGILIIFTSLFMENILIGKDMTLRDMKRISKADQWYGIGSIVVLATGFARIYLVGKGSDYYWSHPLFLLKLSLFTIVGLLSIYPTIQFIKIYKKRKADEATRFTWDDSSRFKLMARLQIGILLIIPFLANMIARGMGVS